MAYDYDIVVIGGGPAGYAGAIRAGQLGKRVLCVERDKLGGICLNWGCIPTKALLTNAHLVELVKNHGPAFGYSGEAKWDFAQMIGRSRAVAGKLNKGVEGLFRKYKVASKFGTAKVIAPHTIQVGNEKVTAESIVIATGVRPRPLPGAEFDGKVIISYKEAMSLPQQPKSMVIIGGGPIGLEFGYFYNAIGTKVTLIELMDRILPSEDEEVSKALLESLTKRGMTIHVKTKTGKVEKTANGVKLAVETPQGALTIEADTMLVSIGVLGNVEGLFDDKMKVEIVKNHIKADPKNGYKTNVPGIYAVGDIIGPPWLAHVAHHEAICCIERLCGHADRTVDYTTIPGCTYTDPG
ncbi:dihydrolipoyl dehydrogenase family protein, partial [Singulisphaera rosea]